MASGIIYMYVGRVETKENFQLLWDFFFQIKSFYDKFTLVSVCSGICTKLWCRLTADLLGICKSISLLSFIRERDDEYVRKASASLFAHSYLILSSQWKNLAFAFDDIRATFAFFFYVWAVMFASTRPVCQCVRRLRTKLGKQKIIVSFSRTDMRAEEVHALFEVVRSLVKNITEILQILQIFQVQWKIHFITFPRLSNIISILRILNDVIAQFCNTFAKYKILTQW